MAMCRSGLLLRLNVKSSNCVMRQPEMARYRLDVLVVVDKACQGRCRGQAFCDVERDDHGTLQHLVNSV